MAAILRPQLSKRGGRRPNAGRKKSAAFKCDPSHGRRPELSRQHPVHVMLRTLPSVPRLRQRDGFEAIRAVLFFFLDDPDFRIVHISIQRNHIHMIVEATSKAALRRGMQSFAIRAARALNEEFGREGKVFAFRYKAKQITTPYYARNVLGYVLNNWRRHREDRYAGEQSMPFDRFSSAVSFAGWSTTWPMSGVDLHVSPPVTALLVSAWHRHGLIDPFEVPGPLAS